jgi:hypothetical protein
MDRLGNLDGLHELYAAFHRAMAADRGRDYPLLDLASFTEWWTNLSPAVRADYAADYERGYERAVSDAGQQIRDFLSSRR